MKNLYIYYIPITNINLNRKYVMLLIDRKYVFQYLACITDISILKCL